MAELTGFSGELVRLRAEIARDRAFVARLGDEVAELAEALDTGADGPTLAFVAVKIHRYYTGLESIIERIERTFGTEPRGADSHVELLRGAALELPGLRPAVLPPAVLEDLREILRFRHFFRHAYAVELDADKLSEVAARVEAASGPVQQALREFDDFLRLAVAELLG